MKHDFDPNKPVIPIAYPRLLLDMMVERGFTRQQILHGSHMDEALFDKPEQRLSPAQFLFLILNYNGFVYMLFYMIIFIIITFY